MGGRLNQGFICLCLAVLADISQGIEVTDKIETHVVENGTEEAVILDCPYTLAEEEGDGLAIKWFHAENPVLIYQWIYGHQPSVLGILMDRVDLEYQSSDEELHMHSGIRILNPTTELSGDYACRVSTYEDEQRVQSKLVVYSKPKSVKIWAKQEGDDKVKVTCEVENTFPEPEVSLLRNTANVKERIPIEEAQRTPSWEKGLYSSSLEVVLDEDNLDGPTHFTCEVTLPNTDVRVVKSTRYEPRVHEHAGAVVSGSETRSAVAIVVSLAFLAVWKF